jgi:hypothetical protein
MRLPERSYVARGVALAAAAVAAWYVPGELRDTWREGRNARSQSELERRLLPARVVGLDDTRIFQRARETIPADATYYVDVGRGGALDWVRPFATYWLLPRRRTDELGEADWILAYGTDPGALGLPYSRVVTVGPGLVLAEVRP